MKTVLIRCCLFACLAVGAMFPVVAGAALVTEVADAADKDNPIDVNLDARWRMVGESATITREHFNGANTATQPELAYRRVTQVMDLKATIGLYHDLELHLSLPYALSDSQSWQFATVGGASVEPQTSMRSSTGYTDNCLDRVCTEQPSPIVIPGKVQRAGFMDPTIGFAWGILGNSRAERPPVDWFPPMQREATLVMGVDYTMPISRLSQDLLNDPSKADPSAPDGSLVLPVSDGTHRIDTWVAMSKQLGAIDPFIRLHYMLPIADRNAFDNCQTVAADEGLTLMTDYARKVCSNDTAFDPEQYWKGQTGLSPQHRGGVMAGMEFTSHPSETSTLLVGAQFGADYVSRGRTYTEVSDMLRKLTFSEQYFALDSRFTVDYRFSNRFHWLTFVGVGTQTKHLLTTETVGKDRYTWTSPSEPPVRELDDNVSVTSPEVNPNYDFRYDQPSRRFGISGVLLVNASTSLSLNF